VPAVGSGRAASALAVVAIGMSLAAIWELYEWVAINVLRSTTVSASYNDTIMDLAEGGVASLVLGLLVAGSRAARIPDRPVHGVRSE
jgi:hypothetical protein